MTLTKSFVRLSVLLVVSLLASTGIAAAPDRPENLLVVDDDLRFDDVGAAGDPFAGTPALTAARFTEQVWEHVVASGPTREADPWVRSEGVHDHKEHRSGFRRPAARR